MELKLTKNNICVKLANNPFIQRKTESGIILSVNGTQSQDSGTFEALQKLIDFAIVTHVGPEVTYLQVGDGVYFDSRSARPLPHNGFYLHLNEGIIMGYVSDDGTLDKLIANAAEEEASFQRATTLRQTLEGNLAEAARPVIQL